MHGSISLRAFSLLTLCANEETLLRIKECISKPLMHSYYYYPTRIRAQFLEKLLDMTPSYLEKAIILSVGTEAAERAVKIAKIFGESENQGKKYNYRW